MPRLRKDKEPRGYRRERRAPDPEPPRALRNGLYETLLNSDAIARITRLAAENAPMPDPEDLLVMWAQQYYYGGGDFFIWQIGYYVAEDLKLRGLVKGV